MGVEAERRRNASELAPPAWEGGTGEVRCPRGQVREHSPGGGADTEARFWGVKSQWRRRHRALEVLRAGKGRASPLASGSPRPGAESWLFCRWDGRDNVTAEVFEERRRKRDTGSGLFPGRELREEAWVPRGVRCRGGGKPTGDEPPTSARPEGPRGAPVGGSSWTVPPGGA